MFHLTDDFRACDANRQPYSFQVERHTETENLHAWVRDSCFCLSSVGNRHILNVPAFSEGRFEMRELRFDIAPRESVFIDLGLS